MSITQSKRLNYWYPEYLTSREGPVGPSLSVAVLLQAVFLWRISRGSPVYSPVGSRCVWYVSRLVSSRACSSGSLSGVLPACQVSAARVNPLGSSLGWAFWLFPVSLLPCLWTARSNSSLLVVDLQGVPSSAVHFSRLSWRSLPCLWTAWGDFWLWDWAHHIPSLAC